MGQRSRRRQWGLKYPLLIGVALIGLLPYYWMVACSFKTNDTMFAVPLQWLPDPINWSAYGTAWRAQDFTRRRSRPPTSSGSPAQCRIARTCRASS